jgi:rubrerythrin
VKEYFSVSIVGSFKKIVDPINAIKEEQERKKEREAKKKSTIVVDSPSYVCRVCQREDAQDKYCPICLADTMKPK